MKCTGMLALWLSDTQKLEGKKYIDVRVHTQCSTSTLDRRDGPIEYGATCPNAWRRKLIEDRDLILLVDIKVSCPRWAV